MKLTLTFDNGPDPEATPRVLEILARHDARAHFFVLGKHVATEAGRALVERILAAGHLVGNHSYSHGVPLGDDPRADAAEREIAATQELLDAIGPGPRWFRPFGGGGAIGPHLLSRRAVTVLCEGRYTCALWNEVPRDWEDPEGWAARALAGLGARPHTVLVLHDFAGAAVAGLDGFLDAARAAGAELTLSYPASCLPIVDGEIVGELGPLVRDEVA
jgi:peptidoglycan-N-acetylglucosamine deacetylase